MAELNIPDEAVNTAATVLSYQPYSTYVRAALTKAAPSIVAAELERLAEDMSSAPDMRRLHARARELRSGSDG